MSLHVVPIAPAAILALTADQVATLRSLLRHEATRIACLAHARSPQDRASQALRFRECAELEHELADQIDAPNYWGMGALDEIVAQILAGHRVQLG